MGTVELTTPESDAMGSGVEPDAEQAAVAGELEAASRLRMPRAAIPSLVLASAIGALELWRKRFQHSQTFLPERYPDGLWRPETYGVTADDVWFHSHDGTLLHGWWMRTRRARGTVLYCHGNSGNITNRIGVYRMLLRHRLDVFAFDYRGYGRSEGRPSEDGLFADARAAYDWLVTEAGESAERILLFGHSLGGAVAIDCVGHRPAAGLVAQSTFTDLKEMAKARFPGAPLHILARNQFRSSNKVRELMLPKLFIHGTSDETIPLELGERLFAEASEPKEWYPVARAGHNDVPRHGGLRYQWRLSRFARRCLRG